MAIPTPRSIMNQVASKRGRPDQMKKDVSRGQEFAKGILGEGLGRIGGDPDIQRVIQERRQLAGGLTGQEMQAARDVAGAGISGAGQTQLRALRAAQAGAGVRGATAGAQQAGVISETAQRKSELERDLLLRQRGAKEAGLAGLEASVTGTRQFDIEQAAREKQMLAAGGLGFAQLGVAERSAAAKAAGSGGK